jgi:16S rRNA (guanine966-N2)-methyltransferase
MRIISGKARGRKIKIAQDVMARPFLEQARGALFNMLTPVLRGASILDLYAGSGALGIEALSRGAKKAVFVEREEKSAKNLIENLATCMLADKAEVINTPVEIALKRLSAPFDIIFLDPPYIDASTWERDKTAKSIVQNTINLLAEKGKIIFRLEKTDSFPESWGELGIEKNRAYGRSRICIYSN